MQFDNTVKSILATLEALTVREQGRKLAILKKNVPRQLKQNHVLSKFSINIKRNPYSHLVKDNLGRRVEHTNNVLFLLFS